jgi:hypothetical protein
MHRVAGALLVAAGGYLAYYWARFKFGDTANVADDPSSPSSSASRDTSAGSQTDADT